MCVCCFVGIFFVFFQFWGDNKTHTLNTRTYFQEEVIYTTYAYNILRIGITVVPKRKTLQTITAVRVFSRSRRRRRASFPCVHACRPCGRGARQAGVHPPETAGEHKQLRGMETQKVERDFMHSPWEINWNPAECYDLSPGIYDVSPPRFCIPRSL